MHQINLVKQKKHEQTMMHTGFGFFQGISSPLTTKESQRWKGVDSSLRFTQL